MGKSKVPYLIDPCMRAGSPPSEVMIESYKNLGEIIWEGADGKLVEPVPAGKFTAIAMMHSKWADTHFMTIEIEPEAQRWVKLKCKTVMDGRTYFVPQFGELYTVGAVVAVADTFKDAIEQVKERSEMVKAYESLIRVDCFDDAEEVIEEGKKFGVEF